MPKVDEKNDGDSLYEMQMFDVQGISRSEDMANNVVEDKLFTIDIAKEVYKSGAFTLEEKVFKYRALPVVKTTADEFKKFDGAWIFMLDKDIVALHSFKDVNDTLRKVFKNHPCVTLSVYFADRPRSYFPNFPRQVGVSLNVINVCEIDTMKQTFHARFIIKTLWEPSKEDVEEFENKGYWATGSGWRPSFIFPNYTDTLNRKQRTWPLKAKQGDTTRYCLSHYLLLRDCELDPYSSELNSLPKYLMYGETYYNGTFTELLELEGFPMDCQDFSIILWSGGTLQEQQIVPFDLFLGNSFDNEHAEGFANLNLCEVNLNNSNILSEWDIRSVHVSIQKAKRSQLYLILKAKRRWSLYLWKFFIPLFLIVLGSQIAFMLSFDDGGDRIGLVFTAILANVVYQLAVYQELPQIPYMTFMDWFNIFYFVLMLAILIESGTMTFISGDYFQENFSEVNINQLRRTDLMMFGVLLLLQFGSLIYFLRWGSIIEKSQEKKLSMNYYEQLNEGIIHTLENTRFVLNASEREYDFERMSKISKTKFHIPIRHYKAQTPTGETKNVCSKCT